MAFHSVLNVLTVHPKTKFVCNFCIKLCVWQVYGGPDLSAPRLAQLCTTRPPNNPLHVSSTGNAVTVRFKSDEYISGRGFNASWQETQGGKQ